MPPRAELWPLLGPLLDIGPRVLAVMAAGILALVTAGLCGRALRDRRPVLFLASWLAGMAAIGSLCLGLASIVAYGRRVVWPSQAAVEPLSSAGAAVFLAAHLAPTTVGCVAGLAVAVVLAWRRAPSDASAETVLMASSEDHARAVGDAGESLVGCELFLLGLPQLRRVILGEGGRTAEVDHLVRLPAGIVVLETKAWGGFVSGTPECDVWVRHGRDGQDDAFLNPAVQNLGHVRAVERFVADGRIAMRGLVIAAGHARFAAEIAPLVVPVRRLGEALGALVWPDGADHAALASAWRRLEREAARSAGRRTDHVSYARGRSSGAGSISLGCRLV